MKWWLPVATLGPVGYWRAPGTCATCISAPLIYMLGHYSFLLSIVLFMHCAALALYSINRTIALVGISDPSYVVIDEVLGTWIALLAVNSLLGLIAAVLIFRILDITKWLGIGYLQRFPDCWGVVADDGAAGLITAVLIYIGQSMV